MSGIVIVCKAPVSSTSPRQTWTSVPSSSPITTRLSAPGLKIENTLIGSFWSRHSAKAVGVHHLQVAAIASSKLMRCVAGGVGSFFGSAV
jgi:hypothetical protein